MKNSRLKIFATAFLLAGVAFFFVKDGVAESTQTIIDRFAEEVSEESNNSNCSMVNSEEKTNEGCFDFYYPNSSFLYEECLKKADSEQKKQLLELQQQYHLLTYEHEKEILQIMGILPSDTPRLTFDQAKAVCAALSEKGLVWDSLDKYEEDVVKRFNQFAGAPDLDGGSGLSYRIYYLNEEGTESIRVTGGLVLYLRNQKVELMHAWGEIDESVIKMFGVSWIEEE